MQASSVTGCLAKTLTSTPGAVSPMYADDVPVTMLGWASWLFEPIRAVFRWATDLRPAALGAFTEAQLAEYLLGLFGVSCSRHNGPARVQQLQTTAVQKASWISTVQLHA